MATKFFNNINHSLFDKLKGIAGSMADFNRFLAIAGFFRSSGYFKLRRELENVEEIKRENFKNPEYNKKGNDKYILYMHNILFNMKV